MKLKTPDAITNSHNFLLSELKIIINNYPTIEDAIQSLNKVMYAHFKKEEGYALSPLGLLLDLSEGKWELDEKTAKKISESVNSKLYELKEEHKDIAQNLPKLKDIAEKENNSDLKKFINNLELHMELEDQVLYPATILIVNSILIGNYFKKNKKNN